MTHAGFGPIDRVKDPLGMDQYCGGAPAGRQQFDFTCRKFKDVCLKVSNKCILTFMEKTVDNLLQEISEPGLSYFDLSKGAESVHRLAVNPNTFKFSLE